MSGKRINKNLKNKSKKEPIKEESKEESVEEVKGESKEESKEEVKEEPVKVKPVKKYLNEEEEAIEVEEKVIEEIKQAEEVEEGPVKAIKEAYDKYIKEQKAIKEDYDKHIKEDEAKQKAIKEELMKKEHEAESLKVLNVESRKLTQDEKNYIIKELYQMSGISMRVPDMCYYIKKYFDCSRVYINDKRKLFTYPIYLEYSHVEKNKYNLYFHNMRTSPIDRISTCLCLMPCDIAFITEHYSDKCYFKATWKKEFI